MSPITVASARAPITRRDVCGAALMVVGPIVGLIAVGALLGLGLTLGARAGVLLLGL